MPCTAWTNVSLNRVQRRAASVLLASRAGGNGGKKKEKKKKKKKFGLIDDSGWLHWTYLVINYCTVRTHSTAVHATVLFQSTSLLQLMQQAKSLKEISTLNRSRARTCMEAHHQLPHSTEIKTRVFILILGKIISILFWGK